MKIRALITLVLLASVVTVFPAGSYSASPPASTKNKQLKEGKVIEQLRSYMECLSYFSLALNSFRRDPRLKSRDLYSAMSSLHNLVEAYIRKHDLPKGTYVSLITEIDDVLYARIDNETRKIWVLVDEYDASCQELVDEIDDAIKRVKRRQP